MTTKTLVEINNVSIQVVEDKAQVLVPIKPICEAFGIDEEAQRQRIKQDEILSLVLCLARATSRDGKRYMMSCLPIKYVFGWLFTISPYRVSDKARNLVIEHRIQCYDVFYEYLKKSKVQ